MRIAANARNTTQQLSGEFEAQSISNLQRIPLLKWQFFASESGLITQFPGLRVTECDYEPRFRYVKHSVNRFGARKVK